MNLSEIRSIVDAKWDADLLPRLVDYVRLPAKSPAFDASWDAHGHLGAAVAAAADWARAQPIPGLVVEIVSLPGRTPCLFFDVPSTHGLGEDGTVLFYGHLDKQPEMTGWREDLGPWTPKIENGRLYGRGAADDSYAMYAALTVIQALDAQRMPRPRCVGLIETCEESGSPDLPAYLEMLAPRLGQVRLVAGLDSGCGNYDQLWVTTSLRGLVGGVLTVEVLQEGVHSGSASGIVPSSFRIARKLLNRLDDVDTGRLIPEGLHAPIPDERIEQARAAGAILGDSVWTQFPWVGCSHGPDAHSHAMPTTTDPVEAILARTWRPALSVVGAEHLPGIAAAGNVLRPKTSLKLSLRLPPTVDGDRAAAIVKRVLEADAPYNAKVSFSGGHGATGWNAPPTAPWLKAAADAASMAAWGRPAAWMGEGGTIPFMNMLGEKFPDAQFLITGVLGPQSNAHGPNEFLHIDAGKRLTAAVAGVVSAVR
ncbi:MAG TPA: M20/M25/M40 family metallo-hydrolase [Burkholderiaceae bacterium]|nr:M20/M25/M40 family metallo-hydrolase [Burkholderiaceae bacterium]